MTQPPTPAPEPNRAQPCDLELLALFGAGELDAAQRDTVSAHLVDCDRCWQELHAQRAVTDAVQQLWASAPAGLRADIRASINAAARSQTRNKPRARPLLVAVTVAAAVVALIGAGAMVVKGLSSRPHHQQVAVRATIPTPVLAAITQAANQPPADSTAPRAPQLSAAGLRLAASGSTTAGGIPAAQYTYADTAGNRVTIFVATLAWPRPPGAAAVGKTTWIITPTTPTSVTVVGGPDQTGEDMLVIATDHTAAMTAAAELGLV